MVNDKETPYKSPPFRSGSAHDGNLDMSEASEMVSIENFEFFLDHIYSDVLSSYYYSFTTLIEQQKKIINESSKIGETENSSNNDASSTADSEVSTTNGVNGNGTGGDDKACGSSINTAINDGSDGKVSNKNGTNGNGTDDKGPTTNGVNGNGTGGDDKACGSSTNTAVNDGSDGKVSNKNGINGNGTSDEKASKETPKSSGKNNKATNGGAGKGKNASVSNDGTNVSGDKKNSKKNDKTGSDQVEQNNKNIQNVLIINDENERYRKVMEITDSKLNGYKNKIKNLIKESEDLDEFKKKYFNIDDCENLNSNHNEVIAKKVILQYNKSISNYLKSTISKLKDDPSHEKWLFNLGQTILDMSQVYTDFKKSSHIENINIKEKFHLLRHYYTEIIEKVKKKRSATFNGLWILHLLDDIFLRIFVWVDKKPNSNTDSVLLRNAFSHFNMVYDEQSLGDSGSAFQKIFLKNNSIGEFENFKKNLKDVTWKNTLRIVFYNQKDGDSDADAMLDTNCYHVCRYFMTYSHCLFAIFSNELSHVPFSSALLEEYESAYLLNVVESSINTSTKLAIKIKKGCEISIEKDCSFTGSLKKELEEDLLIDQDSNFTINVKKGVDLGVVVELTSFSDILITSEGLVTVDDVELSNGNSIMIYGGKKLLISSIALSHDGFTTISYQNHSNYCSITINCGSITTEYLKNGSYDLLIKKDGRLNIYAKYVKVNGDGNEFSINTIGKSGKLSFKQFTQIAGKKISLSPKQNYNSNSKFESSGNFTLVSNGSVKAINYQSLTIESKKGTIKVHVENNEAPKNFIKIYSHKTNHMIKKMNEKLKGNYVLILYESEVIKLQKKITELESIIKNSEAMQKPIEKFDINKNE
ncbi:hypothetical protein ACTFIY_001611 [Dictyostelium cf. discoideum]